VAGLAWAYNTNGFAHHRLEDALRLLARLGYAGVALTLDVQHLDPFRTGPADWRRVRRLVERLGLRVAVETGARFLLDPARKHWPTLISERGRERRERFLRRAIEVAAALGAPVVSLWSGAADPRRPRAATRELLCRALGRLARRAGRAGVSLAFEPEPGMFVEGLADALDVVERVGEPALGLTLDLGHLLLTERPRLERRVREAGGRLLHVHVEDMRRPVHEHLPFGKGEMDFPPVLRALGELCYRGLVAVELSRDGHRAPEAARESILFLRRAARSRLKKGLREG
jgi:sugar phosphate isomerase/epimerase